MTSETIKNLKSPNHKLNRKHNERNLADNHHNNDGRQISELQ